MVALKMQLNPWLDRNLAVGVQLQNRAGLAKRYSAEVSVDAWSLAFPDSDRVKFLPE
jgi:hypothetical protein